MVLVGSIPSGSEPGTQRHLLSLRPFRPRRVGTAPHRHAGPGPRHSRGAAVPGVRPPRAHWPAAGPVSEPQGGRLLTVNGNGTNQIIEMRRHNETRYCTISSTYDKSGDSDVVHMELSMNKGVHDLITGERQEPSHNHVGTSIYFVEFEEKPPK